MIAVEDGRPVGEAAAEEWAKFEAAWDGLIGPVVDLLVGLLNALGRLFDRILRS